MKFQRFECLDRRRQLAFAAVHHQQLGQRLLLVEQTPVASPYHLAHGGIVVTRWRFLDVEVAILLLAWFRIAEHNARCHSVCT